MTNLDEASGATPAPATAALGEPTRPVGAGWIAAFASISSADRFGRSDVWPLGSPTRAVKSPTIRTTV